MLSLSLIDPESIPEAIPVGAEAHRIRVAGTPNPTLPIKPLRAVDGSWQIDVEAADLEPAAMELLGGDSYEATWVGWSYGQVPAYGPTPIAAAQALLRAS